MSNQAIQVLVARTFNSQVASANVVDGFVVNHEAAIRVLQCSVRGENRVVWLNHRGGVLRGRIHAEFQLALLAVVDRKTFHQQGTKARSSAAAERVEDKEALEAGAVVGNTSNLVEDIVNQFFSDGIVSSGIVVGCILFSSDHLLGVKETSVCAGTDFVDDVGLEVAVDGSGDIFAVTWPNRQRKTKHST